MLRKYSTRRQFLNYGKLSLLFLLNSCSNPSKKIKISLQSSFYPKSFKDILPKTWQQENINFEKLKIEKNKTKFLNSDFTLINDGWINSIDLESFQNIKYLFDNDKLDSRSKEFLDSLGGYKSNKLFPIGVVPYALIIKNNKDLINAANQSWDFLLSKKLKGKIIFPQSPRIIMSIAKKISAKNSLSKLKSQAMINDDQNSLNWLINSHASVAILPFSLCLKYLRFDSRLSIVFPEKGVPLMWNFIISRSNLNNQTLIDWVNSLEEDSIIDKLANHGWYLPFKNKYTQSKYNLKTEKNNFGPSKICWENSWSFSTLDNKQKLYLENLWNESSTP